MGIVDEAIQDGVGVGGVTDDAMPGGYGELAGNDRRSAAVAVLKDFQKIVTGLFVERLKTPVVQDQDLNMAQGALQPGWQALWPRAHANQLFPTPEGPHMARLS